MKYFTLLFILLLSVSLSVSGQEKNVKTMDHTFNGGNNGGWTGNMATEVVKTINSVDGIMNVAVNKAPGSWSIIGQYAAGCWSDVMVFDQNNRFVEFRVKCNVAQTTPMKFHPRWGGCDGCCTQNKTYPQITFVIPEANTWTTVFFKFPSSLGGTQNIIDTLSWWIALELANGNYQFDYIKMGLAAVPPVPAIDPVNTKIVYENVEKQFVTLTGISIPGRFIDGLKIKAEALNDGVINDVKIIDMGSGPFEIDAKTNIATATMQYTAVEGMGGSGDSIVITLSDTIRGTTTRTAFYIKLLACPCVELDDITGDISVYPTSVVDFVTIDFKEEFTGEITVVDMLGNIFISQKIEETKAKINLSAAAPGMYIIKISDGKNTFNTKVIKQ